MAFGSDALQPLASPRPVRVRTDRRSRPRAVRLRGRWRGVETIRESWRIDEEWWRQPASRRYYALVLEGGLPVTVYRELTGQGRPPDPVRPAGGWFTHGAGGARLPFRKG